MTTVQFVRQAAGLFVTYNKLTTAGPRLCIAPDHVRQAGLSFRHPRTEEHMFVDNNGNAMVVVDIMVWKSEVYLVCVMIDDWNTGYIVAVDHSNDDVTFQYGLNCMGWFGPNQGWENKEAAIKAIRTW